MDVREKLVEIMEDLGCNDEYCKDCEFCNDIDGCVHRRKEIIADRLIANGVTVQEWISVEDELPDKDGCYIVTACDEGCSCGDGIWYDTVVIEAEYYKGEWSWNENGTEYDITDLVTHWQPMPNPPKGE